MPKICKNNIFRLFIGGLLRIAEEGELKAKMQSLHGWSDKEYGEYLNIFIEKWNSIPDDTLTEEEVIMKESYRYIVYEKNADGGYYYSYYDEKESNKIKNIIAIFRTEKKAKDMCKGRQDLGYIQIIWEE